MPCPFCPAPMSTPKPPREGGGRHAQRAHHDTHEQLRALLRLFVDAYNHARRLKTLHGLTP